MSDLIQVEQDATYGTTDYPLVQDRSYYLAFWQTRRAVTAAEINHVQMIQREAYGKLAHALSQSGWSYRSAWSIDGVGNTMTVDRTFAVLDDDTEDVAGNATSPSGLTPTAITYGIPPAPGSGTEYDLVYLEVWHASVGATGSSASDKNIYTYGAVSPSAGVQTNDLQRSNITQETTRRIQTRWRIRTVRNVGFSSANPNGFLDRGAVYAQAGAVAPNPLYTFIDMGTIRREYSGLWRAGNQDTTTCTALGCTDGFVFALPMFEIIRTAGVNPPTVIDLRQLTNGNFVGVFNLIAPCTLQIKALPVEFFDCSGLIEQARVSASILNPALTPLVGVVAAGQLQSTLGTGVAPLVVSSTTLVNNLNADTLHGAPPGTAASNVLLLDALGNAAISGAELRMYNGALSGANDLTRITNVGGALWAEVNASYSGGIWSQTNGAKFSAAMSIDPATGIAQWQYCNLATPTITWVPTLTIDKTSNLSTFNTNVLVKSGNLGVGLTVPAAFTLDVLGAANILATGSSVGLTITGNANANALAVTTSVIPGSGSAIYANNTAASGYSLYATSVGTSSRAVYAQQTGSGGYALYATGKSVFAQNGGEPVVRVGVNNTSPAYELDITGTSQTVNLKVTTGTPLPNPSLGALPDIQTINFNATPTGGTFTISFNAVTSGNLTAGATATAAAIQTALQAMSSIGNGNVLCTGGPLSTTNVVCTFAGALASAPQPNMTINNVSITPSGTYTVTHTQTGNTATGVFVLAASDTLGTASWTQILGASAGAMNGSGTINSVPIFSPSTNALASGIMLQTGNLTTSNLGAGFTSTTGINAQFTVAKAILVNGLSGAAVADTVANQTPLLTSALIFGNSGGTAGTGCEAIFSNQAAGSGATNLGGLSFMTNKTVKMIIGATSQVGIGLTTLPALGTMTTSLEVAGSIGIGAGLINGTTTTSATRVDYPYLTLTSNVTSGNHRSGIQWTSTNGGTPTKLFELSSDDLGSVTSTAARTLRIYDNVAAATRMLMDVNGNFGFTMGATAVAYSVDVGGRLRVGAGSGAANSLLIGGNTTSYATSSFSTAEIANDTSALKALVLTGNNSNDHVNYVVSIKDWLTMTSTGARLTMSDSGARIGVGTTAPASAVHAGGAWTFGSKGTGLSVLGTTLGTTAGNTTALASVGWTNGTYDLSLLTQGYRVSSGSDQTTAVLTLGLQVNATASTAYLAFSNTNGGAIGVNNVNPATKIDIISTVANDGVVIRGTSSHYLAMLENVGAAVFTTLNLSNDGALIRNNANDATGFVIAPIGNGAGAGMRWDSAGKLAFNQTYPSTSVHIHGLGTGAGTATGNSGKGQLAISSSTGSPIWQGIDFYNNNSLASSGWGAPSARIAVNQSSSGTTFALYTTPVAQYQSSLGISGTPAINNGAALVVDYLGNAYVANSAVAPYIQHTSGGTFLDDVIRDTYTANLRSAIQRYSATQMAVLYTTIPIGINIKGTWCVNTATAVSSGTISSDGVYLLIATPGAGNTFTIRLQQPTAGVPTSILGVNDRVLCGVYCVGGAIWQPGGWDQMYDFNWLDTYYPQNRTLGTLLGVPGVYNNTNSIANVLHVPGATRRFRFSQTGRDIRNVGDPDYFTNQWVVTKPLYFPSLPFTFYLTQTMNVTITSSVAFGATGGPSSFSNAVPTLAMTGLALTGLGPFGIQNQVNVIPHTICSIEVTPGGTFYRSSAWTTTLVPGPHTFNYMVWFDSSLTTINFNGRDVNFLFSPADGETVSFGGDATTVTEGW